MSEIVIARLARPDASALLVPVGADDIAELQREFRDLKVRRDAIAEGFADGSISFSQFDVANAKLVAWMAGLEARMPTQTLPAPT